MSYLNINRKPSINDIIRMSTMKGKKYKVCAFSLAIDYFGEDRYLLECSQVTESGGLAGVYAVNSTSCYLLNPEQIEMFPEAKYVLS